MDASERIWETVAWGDPVIDKYDPRRPNQPCSTDEFLRRLMDSQLYADEWRVAAIEKWLSGDFTAAMEGLE